MPSPTPAASGARKARRAKANRASGRAAKIELYESSVVALGINFALS
jgi:hypothetical protein